MNKIKIAIFLSLLLLFVGCTAEDPGYSVVVDTDTDPITIDPTTSAITVISDAEYRIHEGNSFFVMEFANLANNNVRDLQITTPNTTEWTHFTFEFETEVEYQWFFYENVTINVAGANHPEYGHNRTNAHAATLVVNFIDNINVGAANADTAVAGATVIAQGISGSNKDGGSAAHELEIILAQNEDYSLRYVANAAGYVNYHLDWYEHQSDD